MFLTGILAWSSNRKKTRASVSKGKPFITDISRAHFPESLQENKHLPLLASEAAQGEERTGGQAQAARAGMRAIRKLPMGKGRQHREKRNSNILARITNSTNRPKRNKVGRLRLYFEDINPI